MSVTFYFSKSLHPNIHIAVPEIFCTEEEKVEHHLDC